MVTIGIGQDKLLVTPLQIANAICIVANKGYYYTPHFVKKFDDETEEDTVFLNKYRKKHEVLTHISDSVYNIVIDGMEGVTEVGTAAGIPKIPGVNICAKTGTAENYTILDKKRVQLKDHSLFVAFAPREDPKIVVAVIVENGGFGATWAGPMAYLMIEKYLKDTLRADRLQEVDRIAAANLMPSYLPRLQYKEDSVRAYYWFKLTKDSNYIRKYAYYNYDNKTLKPEKKELPAPVKKETQVTAILNDDKYPNKKAISKR